MQRFAQGMGMAFSVWTVLIGVSVAAVLVAMCRGWREALLRAWVRTAATTLRRARASNRAELLAAYADQMAEAKRLAARSVRERRDEWEAAGHTLDAAWQGRRAVDVAATRLAFASLPSGLEPPRPDGGQEPDPVELAGCGRLLRRMATEAYRRGDLSGTQLIEVLTGRGAWSTRHDLAELETRLCMAARDHRRRQYRLAVNAERKAWDALEAARGAQDALLAVQPDLEIVVFGDDGGPDFATLRRTRLGATVVRARSAAITQPAVFFAFDVIWHAGRDLRRHRLVDRLGILQTLPLSGALALLDTVGPPPCWRSPKSTSSSVSGPFPIL